MAVLAPGGVDGKCLVACDPVLHKLNCPTCGPLRASAKNTVVFPKTRLPVGWLVFPFPPVWSPAFTAFTRMRFGLIHSVVRFGPLWLPKTQGSRRLKIW